MLFDYNFFTVNDVDSLWQVFSIVSYVLTIDIKDTLMEAFVLTTGHRPEGSGFSAIKGTAKLGWGEIPILV